MKKRLTPTTMKNFRVWPVVGLSVIALTTICFTLKSGPQTGNERSTPEMLDSTKTRVSQTSSVSKEQLQEKLDEIQKRARELAESKAKVLAQSATELRNIEGFQRARLESIRNSVNEMLAASGTIYTKRLRKEIMDDMLQDSTTLPLLQKVLSDVEFARAAFPEDQGKMRHFGVETLAYAAKKGNSAPLINTLSEVSHNLAAVEGKLDPGRVEDLRELVVAYAQNIPQGQINAESVRALGYSNELNSELADTWKSSVFLGAWRKMENVESAREFATSVFKQG